MEQVIETFLDYITVEKGFSHNTREAYRNDLGQFVKYLDASLKKQGVSFDWAVIDRDNLLDYLVNLKERNYAPSTISRKTAAIKSFFDFLLKENIIKEDPADTVTSLPMDIPVTLEPSILSDLLLSITALSNFSLFMT